MRQRVRTLQGTEESDFFGQRIGLVGDVDGDGVDDVGIAWRGPAFDTPGYLSLYSAATMKRLTVLEGPPTAVFDPTGWNTIRVKVVGNTYHTWLNGHKIMTYHSDTIIPEGPIGIQVHPKREMDLWYKNIQIAEL